MSLEGFAVSNPKELRSEVRSGLRDFMYITLGVFSACFALNSILIPNSFIDGGVTGISLIVNEIFGISISLLIVLINLPFIVLAFKAINKRFAYKSIIGILMLALSVHLFQFPVLTDEKLLVAVFGGFFLGLGIGLAVRGGAILDGTEVLAIYVSRRTSLSVGSVIMIFNVFIFGTAAYFLSIETALYAIVTYFSASKTVDFVIDGIEEYIGVTIISPKSEEIRQSIVSHMRRGCTIYNGKSGFVMDEKGLKDIQIVYTVITRLEMSRLQRDINKIDKNAFVIMNSIKDTKGGMLRKKPISKIEE